MHMKYPHKVRSDFLHDLVKQLVKQRHHLRITQDDLNDMLGVADRLVSHWECGVRTPSGFNLYCWADALQSKLVIIPKGMDDKESISLNHCQPINDNKPLIIKNKLGINK